MSKNLTGAAAAVAAALLTTPSSTWAQANAPITSGQWHVLAIDGKVNKLPAHFTIDEDGRVSGQAACNRYFGQNVEKLPKLSLPNLGATRKLCTDMSEEDALFDTLGVVDRLELRQGHLLLLGPKGRVIELVRDREAEKLFCISCAE